MSDKKKTRTRSREPDLVRDQITALQGVKPSSLAAHIRENKAKFRPGTWMYIFRQLGPRTGANDTLIDECWAAFLGVDKSIEANDGIKRATYLVDRAARWSVGSGNAGDHASFVTDFWEDFLLPASLDDSKPEWVDAFFKTLDYALKEAARKARGERTAGGMSEVPKEIKRAKRGAPAPDAVENEGQNTESDGDAAPGQSSPPLSAEPWNEAEWAACIERALSRRKMPEDKETLEWLDEILPEHLADHTWQEGAERTEVRDALMRAIERLPPAERDALALFAADVQVKRGKNQDKNNVILGYSPR